MYIIIKKVLFTVSKSGCNCTQKWLHFREKPRNLPLLDTLTLMIVIKKAARFSPSMMKLYNPSFILTPAALMTSLRVVLI